jgi:hypothetical protein
MSLKCKGWGVAAMVGMAWMLAMPCYGILGKTEEEVAKQLGNAIGDGPAVKDQDGSKIFQDQRYTYLILFKDKKSVLLRSTRRDGTIGINEAPLLLGRLVPGGGWSKELTPPHREIVEWKSADEKMRAEFLTSRGELVIIDVAWHDKLAGKPAPPKRDPKQMSLEEKRMVSQILSDLRQREQQEEARPPLPVAPGGQP